MAFSNKQIIASILLILVIFISLALSQFPLIMSMATEGMADFDSETPANSAYDVIRNIALDTAEVPLKLTAIRANLKLVENKKFVAFYNEIIDNTQITDAEKIAEIKKFTKQDVKDAINPKTASADKEEATTATA